MDSNYTGETKSTIILIMNEVDDLSDDEKSFVLYWLRAKKMHTQHPKLI